MMLRNSNREGCIVTLKMFPCTVPEISMFYKILACIFPCSMQKVQEISTRVLKFTCRSEEQNRDKVFNKKDLFHTEMKTSRAKNISVIMTECKQSKMKKT